MRKVSADLVFTNMGDPISNGVVIFDESSGEILEISSVHNYTDGVEQFNGIIVPGYINAHCHLELSHLKSVIDTGTGLIPFIKGVVGLRNFPQHEIDQAIENADREMWANGIVAVGDISNQSDTAQCKRRSEICYYTFVELFDFLQEDKADQLMEDHQNIYHSFDAEPKDKKSYVPHAPYTVSKRLYELIEQKNQPGQTISIHNQEMIHEDMLFRDRSGQLIDFFRDFGISLESFESTGKSSIHATLHNLNPIFNTLMVHNTCTTEEDIEFAHRWNTNTYWVTCANANLYIENRLPRYQNFINQNAKMCIGTDSLTSNWQLCIFEEMRTIKKYQSFIDDYELIKWATINGAEALGFDHLGKFKKGTAPGINHIDVSVIEGRFDLSTARQSTKLS